ncbi:hypothetical protein [Variovorax paradoxus]|uniref:hypothetical protein n=1 Tax=Variovorax paradoxus TaxID=34073 RepID=UPI002480A4A5|nr:hypothetical protein [Variovorax paradoxus]WGT64979.1 hypothetical protein QHG62_06455 [Variovorax paradoxus]
MKKTRALELLGGSVGTAAEAVGISSAAVSQWPDDLPSRIEDRVLAALARKHLPAEMIGDGSPTPVSDARGRARPCDAIHISPEVPQC